MSAVYGLFACSNEDVVNPTPTPDPTPTPTTSAFQIVSSISSTRAPQLDENGKVDVLYVCENNDR